MSRDAKKIAKEIMVVSDMIRRNRRADSRRVSVVTQEDADRIMKMTDANRKTDALIYLYTRVFRDKEAAKALKLIDGLADYFGKLPRELDDLRYRVFHRPAVEKIKNMDEVSRERLMKAL